MVTKEKKRGRATWGGETEVEGGRERRGGEKKGRGIPVDISQMENSNIKPGIARSAEISCQKANPDPSGKL